MILMRHDLLADMFVIIKNAESVGKDSCMTPASNLIKNILHIIQKKGYIGDFEYIDDKRGGHFKVNLLGKINDIGVIKPRFSIPKKDFISWEKRFLPASTLGLLLVSTSAGVISHSEAKEKGIGGKVLGYVY